MQWSNSELRWKTSSRCSNGTCVQVAFAGQSVVLRDSKDPEGPKLQYSAQEWRDFIAGAKSGEFDLD